MGSKREKKQLFTLEKIELNSEIIKRDKEGHCILKQVDSPRRHCNLNMHVPNIRLTR